jgi:hypothetical protein
MFNTIEQSAVRKKELEYLNSVWNNSVKQISEGKCSSMTIDRGKPCDLDYVLTTVMVTSSQLRHPIDAIENIQKLLATEDPDHYYYPSPTLHITLMGCTQRFSERSIFRSDWVKKIDTICAQVLTRNLGRIQLELKGVNLIESSVFIQVFPSDHKIEEIRHDLAQLLLDAGETPIIFSEPNHLHMNIAKLTHTHIDRINSFINLLSRLRSKNIGILEVNNVDLIIADRLMSQEETTFVNRYFLS